MASSEPIPLYFFSLTPSAKKYSPGASEVPANIDPIITEKKSYIAYNTFSLTTKKVSQP
jgi:hypothetical protein